VNYKTYIKEIQDFPKKGVSFKDITPLLNKGKVFNQVINKFIEFAKSLNINKIVAIEARGFIFGAAVASKMKIGFIPIRKPNKLPRDSYSISYELEYGTNILCLHKDSINHDDRVLIIDDLLASGGSAKAAIELINKTEGTINGLAFLIELVELEGYKKLVPYTTWSLIKY